ncbi:MAG: hypothetical protein HY738_24270, partial [Bacteroidia bacterium]|nr:hypothetical protein [Bacteroidia bacterium]
MYSTSSIMFFILVLLFAACTQQLDKDDAASHPDVQTHSRASHPVFYINPDSLTIITPGENGIP